MSVRIGLLRFPGSNCDQDCLEVFRRHFSIDLVPIWHSETALPRISGIIIPGGFSYGDYLRSGALASHAPVMLEVKKFARAGGPVMGVCNGFQVLTEAQLLPGVLLPNASQRFVCKTIALRGETGSSPWQKILKGTVTHLPIAHGQGRFYCDQEGMRRLQGEGQVVARYSDRDGQVTDATNPNGSLGSIAGIASTTGRIFGLMPHPERATDVLLGAGTDGLIYWKIFLELCA